MNRPAKPKASRAKKSASDTPFVAWKGFDSDLRCQGFQFEVGKSYTHSGRVTVCSSGFHACENPLDVWSYYGLSGDNRFCRVRLSGATDRRGGDSKIAAETIVVETEVTLGEMIDAGVKHEIEAANKTAKTKGVNASSGNSARNASFGHYARNASFGHYARNASSGNSARNASSGNSATNASSGACATNASSGAYARNASSGAYARNAASGRNSVIAAAGLNSHAKGADGTAIALPYKDAKGQIRFVCGVVGEKGLKADTWYRAKAGKLVAS